MLIISLFETKRTAGCVFTRRNLCKQHRDVRPFSCNRWPWYGRYKPALFWVTQAYEMGPVQKKNNKIKLDYHWLTQERVRYTCVNEFYISWSDYNKNILRWNYLCHYSCFGVVSPHVVRWSTGGRYCLLSVPSRVPRDPWPLLCYPSFTATNLYRLLWLQEFIDSPR